MKKVKLFMACLLAVVSTTLFAQNITVKGTVSDASNGEPITGAAVMVQGSATSYALTDAAGAFSNAGEQASMQYDGSNQNPVFDFEWSRDGISSCTSMHNKLVARDDPRGDRVYWNPSSWIHYTMDSVVPKLAPTGEPEECQYVYAYDAWFFVEVAPIHFLSYHELQFLKAEAQVRLGQTAAAKETLKGAVEAAFENFEVNVAAALAAPSVNAYGGIDDPGSDPLTVDDADGYFDEVVAPLFDADPFK